MANLISEEELQSSMNKQHSNNTISNTIKQLSNLIYKSDCALILINQIRNDLKAKKYGAETTIADRMMNTYASIRLDIRQTNEIHKYDQIIGAKLKISIKKNKTALKKGTDVFVKHYYNSGIDTLDDLLELACNAEIISKNGSWYTYKDLKIQGKQEMLLYLKQNYDLVEDIYDRTIKHYFK
jgi:recombination protein RecA